MRSFLQSPEWEAFQKLLGRRTYRRCDMLLIEHTLPFGQHYLYAPRPLLDTPHSLAAFLEGVREIARDQGTLFLRIDPLATSHPLALGSHAAPSIQPRHTTFLDLTASEEELLAGMHAKTRYNIRLAERKEVRVDQAGSGDLGRFLDILRETSARDHFRTHEPSHYEKLLEVRSGDFSNELFFATYRRAVLAGALVNFYRPFSSATYLHGASSRNHREKMAPHLLHWRIAQEAKKRGFRTYDLWGVDAKDWPGLTRFKLGFGGSIREYPPSVDFVFQPLRYLLYRFARMMARGFLAPW